MMFNMAAIHAYADETADTGQYVSDVFIAYGKSEAKASEWLTKHGWEPVKGDFNAGKASFFDDNKLQDQNVTAVMGIRRTGDKNDAITDMAVMNMKGGYSLPDYQKLLEQKKSEIKEFVNNFMVVIEEFRANKNGEGSVFGKKRADLAYDMLNKFYDGNPEGPNAVNDTGKKLGELLVSETRQEGNEKGGDLEQMVLESSGPAMTAVETLLVLGADTGQDSWLERAGALTGETLEENLALYAPEAEGVDVAASAVPQYLGQKYGDTAMLMAEYWEPVNSDMLWLEQYNDEHQLWQDDDESDEDFVDRINAYLDGLRKTEDPESMAEANRYDRVSSLYYGLYEIRYEGDWGETLGDFFNPADAEWNYPSEDYFLPLAAALSEGQRAGLQLVSLETLILLGLESEKVFDSISPEIKKIIADDETFDLYTGVNRAAFRNGVALTSEALMEQNAGRSNAFNEMWNNTGMVAMATYAGFVVGAVTFGLGTLMAVKGFDVVTKSAQEVQFLQGEYNATLMEINMQSEEGVLLETISKADQAELTAAESNLEAAQGTKVVNEIGVTGRVFMGIGGALMIAAAVVSAIRLYKYYDRDMTPIPRMIVDESDIVTYLTDDDGKPLLDENGKQKKNIDFKTYEYYTSVKCNRPDVGEIGDWNDGVSDYKNQEHYCYDIADLNADMGQEWVALYTVKSQDKGDPILADSLTLQYGSKSMPKGCSKGLHLFTYTNTVDLGDTAWAYNNGKKGVYFFWDADKEAFAQNTASAFGTGQMALAAISGLLLGIAGTTLVIRAKRRKENEPEAA